MGKEFRPVERPFAIRIDDGETLLQDEGCGVRATLLAPRGKRCRDAFQRSGGARSRTATGRPFMARKNARNSLSR